MNSALSRKPGEYMEKDYMKFEVEALHLQSTIDNLDMGDMTLDE